MSGCSPDGVTTRDSGELCALLALAHEFDMPFLMTALKHRLLPPPAYLVLPSHLLFHSECLD